MRRKYVGANGEMDLYKTIRQLYQERERLSRVIASLEELEKLGAESVPAPEPPKRPRRGRKAMDAEERRAVSERMKTYWAARRKGTGPQSGPA